MRPRTLLAAAVLAAGAGIALVPQQATANGCVHANFAGGVGSANDPFRVSTPAQLQAAAAGSCVSYSFVLTNDIDLTGRGEFTPIGDLFFPFIGTWDGRGHSITGLSISSPAGEGYGLFGTTIGATIRNMTVRGSVSGGFPYAGIVVGLANDTTISGVHASGTVSSVGPSGGIAAYLEGSGSSVTDSSVDASVTANGGASAGGIAGEAGESVSLTRVQVKGPVEAPYASAGGVVGMATGAAISLATTTSNLNGNVAGGVIGTALPGTATATSVTDSSATGRVVGGAGMLGSLGGIIGNACAGNPSIVRTFFAGELLAVPGSSPTTGGILGGTNPCVVAVAPTGTVTGNLWNTDTAGAAGAGTGVGAGKTTIQLKQIGTYTEQGWSIVNGWEAAGSSTWGICPEVNNGYPYLQWTGAGRACVTPTTPAALTATVLPSRTRMTSGQRLRIGIRVKNGGGTTSASVTSCLRLPARMVVVRAPGATRSGRTACFSAGSLAAGATTTKTLTARAVSARRVTVAIGGTAQGTGATTVAAAPKGVIVTPRRARARVTG